MPAIVAYLQHGTDKGPFWTEAVHAEYQESAPASKLRAYGDPLPVTATQYRIKWRGNWRRVWRTESRRLFINSQGETIAVTIPPNGA